MIVLAKPIGRGYRTTTEFRVEGRGALPYMVALRSVFEFAGIVWRVIQVMP